MSAIESFETVRMRKDCRRIDIALTVSPIRDERGEVTGVSTIARDISEQKAAERRLAESARHFELINDLVATCGFDGYFKRLNDAWEPTLRLDQGRAVPKPFIELVHPEDRAAVETEVARLARGGTTAEFKIRRADQRRAAGCGRSGRRRRTADAGLFYCVGREISERMEAERVLAAERRQFADAQQIASVGSWELDLETRRAHLVGPAVPQPRLRARSSAAEPRARCSSAIHPEDRRARARAAGQICARRRARAAASPTG